MSKNNAKTAPQRGFSHSTFAQSGFLRGSVLSLLMAGTLAGSLALPASAAIYQADFDEITDIESRTMDWRSPSVDVYFDVPESDWIDGIELLVSARPNGKVSPRMPIMVSFNDAKSVPIYAQGRAFDARVKLNKSHIRSRRNKVTFTYNTPAGYNCLSEENGAWALDFTQSSIVLKTRAKSRTFRIGEFEDLFSMAATAPKTVALITKGPSAQTLQMLAAQGVGLRAKTLPDFKLSAGRSDVEIIIGRRDELRGTVRDKAVLSDSGPRAALLKGRPMRLVLTGDTDAEVLHIARSFASHSLPGTRRKSTSAGEIDMQPSFGSQSARITTSRKINALPGQIIGADWGTAARIHTFSVTDPSVSSGRVLLRLSAGKHVSEDSIVQVKLNGESLGYTALDRLRKSVTFDIPQGQLNASGNTLEILPNLDRKYKTDTCGYAGTLPAFNLGEGSKISLRRHNTSPMTELSRFAATGAPFSVNQGEDTVVVMASGSAQNRAASLKVLAQLAKVSGQSWTQAKVAVAGDITADYADKNLLILGPKTRAVNSLIKGGPKSLNAALQGRTLNSGDVYQTASVETFAAAGEAETLRLYAARQKQNSRITRGGVAALYPSPSNPTRLVGVISTSNGGSFNVAANQLVKDDHWNKLEGSVSRWNKSNVLMAQTAIPEPGAMRVARMRDQERTPAVDFVETLFASAAKEARTVSAAATDKFTEIRARVKDRFSQPLQARNTPAEPATVTAKPVPKIKPAAKTAPAVKVASNTAAPQMRAPALRGFSAPPKAAKKGLSLQDLKLPKIDWDSLKAKMAQHTDTVGVYAKKGSTAAAAKATGLVDALEAKTSSMTVLWLGIGLFFFSLIGFIHSSRRTIKYFYTKDP